MINHAQSGHVPHVILSGPELVNQHFWTFPFFMLQYRDQNVIHMIFVLSIFVSGRFATCFKGASLHIL